MSRNEPLVSVLTPVFNGGTFLAECIESVLAQTYDNWEYVIVNNCSTDNTLAIADDYARKDRRIKVHANDKFVGVIENHNIAFSLISAQSKYCKVVSADDWIVPDSIDKMVELAEAHRTVAIVGSYQQSEEKVRWRGLPLDKQVVSGREVCRLSLLENLDVFGTPTSLMYRSDLVRANKPFFPHSLPHADTSTCFKYLQFHDFGFVHKVLCAERVHAHQISSNVNWLGAGNVAFLENFLTYGPIYLSEAEFGERKRYLLEGYLRWLGGSVLKMREKEFWKYHASRLRELGYPIQWTKVLTGTVEEIVDEIRKPSAALAKLSTVIKSKYQNRHGRNS